MTTNETAARRVSDEAARENARPNANLDREPARRKCTAAPVASLADARARRARLLLAAEEIPDQHDEAGAWGDPRGAA